MSMMLGTELLLAGAAPLRPQDVFATSLYTGNGGTQTITNGLDLAGKGGLVWAKRRNTNGNNLLNDTLRGPNNGLTSNDTAAENLITNGATFGGAFLSNGFSMGNSDGNVSGSTYASWSFRRAKKFLDIVTFTTDASGSYTGAHALGTTPGMMIAKAREVVTNWFVWHRTFSNSARNYLLLNTTDAVATNGVDIWDATPSTFSVKNVGANRTYVAYLFAHNPDLIDCGSYVGNGSANGPAVTCGKGWKPQFVMLKAAGFSENWVIVDTARNPSNPASSPLYPNLSSSESATNILNFTGSGFQPATGGTLSNQSGTTYIYLAIRSPT